MSSVWFRRIFVGSLKFLQTKEWGPNFRKEAILQKDSILWSPFLCFIFKSFNYWISSSFLRFQWILHDSGLLFSEFLNFCKLNKWDLISGGNQFCRMSGFDHALLYFNFKCFKYPISLSFIRFQCILHDPAVIFSESWNFCKLKR